MARYERKDRLHQRAKDEGLRSRAAYKLEELQREWKLLRPGMRVVELGCWPGGWLQVLAKKVGPEGRVVGIDTRAVDPLGPNVELLRLDFTELGAADAILAALGGPAQALLSDAAPTLSGIKDVDRGAAEELHESTLALTHALLEPGGFLIAKGFPGPPADVFRRELRTAFASVSERRPEGKRSTSKEFYWLARGFGEKRPARR